MTSRLYDFTAGLPIRSQEVDDEFNQLVAEVNAIRAALPSTPESGLKIVRGRVNSDGSVAAGTGFTVAKIGTGHYNITFSPVFSSVPAVGPGAQSGTHAGWFSPTASAVTILTTIAATTTLVDSAFHFVAVG